MKKRAEWFLEEVKNFSCNRSHCLYLNPLFFFHCFHIDVRVCRVIVQNCKQIICFFWLEGFLTIAFESYRLISSTNFHVSKHQLSAGTCDSLLTTRSTRESAASALQIYQESGKKGDAGLTCSTGNKLPQSSVTFTTGICCPFCEGQTWSGLAKTN